MQLPRLRCLNPAVLHPSADGASLGGQLFWPTCCCRGVFGAAPGRSGLLHPHLLLLDFLVNASLLGTYLCKVKNCMSQACVVWTRGGILSNALPGGSAEREHWGWWKDELRMFIVKSCNKSYLWCNSLSILVNRWGFFFGVWTGKEFKLEFFAFSMNVLTYSIHPVLFFPPSFCTVFLKDWLQLDSLEIL